MEWWNSGCGSPLGRDGDDEEEGGGFGWGVKLSPEKPPPSPPKPPPKPTPGLQKDTIIIPLTLAMLAKVTIGLT